MEFTTRLQRSEEIIMTGHAGLGEGTRGMTFAPGRMALTDRRLIIESRLKTDRTALAYALSAIVDLRPLDDGFVMTLEDGTQEAIIVFGTPDAWLEAIETARRTAPRIRTPVRQREQASPAQARRRAFLAVIVILAVTAALLFVCTLAGGFALIFGGG
ncbi:MAG: hypothetical protein GYB64_03245 [Chloroflexi bacterium]|nr:hypothetical protein [Chloroflexota bacterium]